MSDRPHGQMPSQMHTTVVDIAQNALLIPMTLGIPLKKVENGYKVNKCKEFVSEIIVFGLSQTCKRLTKNLIVHCEYFKLK